MAGKRDRGQPLQRTTVALAPAMGILPEEGSCFAQESVDPAGPGMTITNDKGARVQRLPEETLVVTDSSGRSLRRRRIVLILVFLIVLGAGGTSWRYSGQGPG